MKYIIKERQRNDVNLTLQKDEMRLSITLGTSCECFPKFLLHNLFTFQNLSFKKKQTKQRPQRWYKITVYKVLFLRNKWENPNNTNEVIFLQICTYLFM